MPDSPDETAEIKARLSALEVRVERVAADATAARHLAAAHDREIADLDVRTDAHRAAINALGVQTAARFDRLDARFDRLEREMKEGFAQVDLNFEQVDRNFATMRHRLDQTAAGQQRIADMLTVLIERGEDRQS